jgi:transcriptional regulator with XRE-family HTH domain
MSVSPNSVKQARDALGARLRELRQHAGINGKQLAESLGWQNAKISKIELGRQTPTAGDITAWTSATGSEEVLDELLAALRNLELQYAEWRRVLRTGTRAAQQATVDLEARTKLIRAFECTWVPGLLQTAEYARHRFAEAVELHEIVDDIEEGVRTRMRRQEILYQPRHRLHFVITEAVLYYQLCPSEVLAGQLDRILAITSLRSLRLGIIPFSARLQVSPRHGFWIYDDALVKVETLAAELNLVQPQEIALYAKVFHQLATAAVYGAHARRLVTQAAERLSDVAPETAPTTDGSDRGSDHT